MTIDDQLRQQAEFARRAQRVRQRFIEVLPHAEATQRQLLLQELVAPNADTVFGREHGFAAISSVNDFRRAVPIREFSEVEPWIKRAMAGEERVLTAEPPVAFNRTSGTSGTHKHIPVTRTYMQTGYVDRVMLPLANCFEYHPEILNHVDSVLNFIRDRRPVSARTTTGAPITSLTNSIAEYARDHFVGEPGSFAPWAGGPPAEIESEYERRYYYLRQAAACRLRAIFAINPSTLIAFADVIAASTDRLIGDLEERSPTRAAELARIAKTKRLQPSDIWPTLTLVTCWTAGACKLYIPRVRSEYGPSVEILPTPTASTEGPIAFPVDRHPTGGMLMVGHAFFELIPAEVERSPWCPTLLAHELEVGRDYEIVMSQATGLYRYAIGDIVRVLEYVGRTPRVEFVGRKGVFSSFTGEKLTELQVIEAQRAALEAWAHPVINITCVPVWDDRLPYYCFLVEPVERCGERELLALAVELERQLRSTNEEYEWKRSTDRLGALEVIAVGRGTFARWRDARLMTTGAGQQLKERVIQRDSAALRELLTLSDNVVRIRDTGVRSTGIDQQ